MAAEKLILRGVMWGADKVPDHWFEKIPGGFYGSGQKKLAELEHKESAPKSANKKPSKMKKGRSSRRYSDDDYEDDKPRRGEYDDGYRSDGHHDQGFRSDAYRRHGRGDGHTRFDGGDDAGFDEINNRPRRQRSRNARYDDDDDRYGYGDGHRPPFRDTNPRKPRAQKQSHYPDPVPRHQGPPEWPPMGYYAAPAAMGDAATMNASSAYGSPIPGTHAGAQSTSSLRGGISTGYVPYAHIYGGPTHPQSNFGVFAPPPKSEQGSVQPSHVNQVASPERSRPAIKRPPAGYQQNPLAQEAPAGNQPGYLVDPNSRDYDERQDDYSSENERQQSRSPPRRRRSRLEHSQDRHRSPESRDGRHSSRRERSRHDDRAKSHGRARETYVDDHFRKTKNVHDQPKPDSRRKRASEHRRREGYYSD